MKPKEAIYSCIFGGAVGDALGAPAEFMSYDEIVATYGKDGINEMHPAYGFQGCITDDTQLSLFTAYALSQPHEHLMKNMRQGYIDWWFTQKGGPPKDPLDQTSVMRRTTFGLTSHKALWGDLGGGETCLKAFEYMLNTGEDFPPTNDRKGCGAVMRSAPFGLVYEPVDAFQKAVDCAKLSHHHPDGVYSAGAFAHLIAQLVEDVPLFTAACRTLEYLKAHHGDTDTCMLFELAVTLGEDRFTKTGFSEFGQGWTGEEALAIALYCSLTSPDYKTGVLRAVNHDGDSDSTAAMTGSILGLVYGVKAIPNEWIDSLHAIEAIDWVCDQLTQSIECADIFGNSNA